MRRHDPAVRYMKQLIAELEGTKKLGDIVYMRMFLSAGGDYCNIDGDIKSNEPKDTKITWPISPDWVPENRAKEYEHFVNVCSHDINLIRYIFPKMPIVKSVAYKKNAGKIALLDFESFPGVFEWGDTLQPTKWEEGIEIIYQKGTMRLDLSPAFLRNQPSKISVYEDRGRSTGLLYQPTFDWDWAFKNQAKSFIENLVNKTQPIANGIDSFEDFNFIDQIWKGILNE